MNTLRIFLSLHSTQSARSWGAAAFLACFVYSPHAGAVDQAPAISTWELVTPQLKLFRTVCLDSRMDISGRVAAVIRAGAAGPFLENPEWALDRLKGDPGTVWAVQPEGAEPMLVATARTSLGTICEVHAQHADAKAVADDMLAYAAGRTSEANFVSRLDHTLPRGKYYHRELRYHLTTSRGGERKTWSLVVNVTDDPSAGTQFVAGLMLGK